MVGEAKFRLQIDGKKWLYADSVALAGGLGTPNTLKSVAADPQMRAELEGSGRLVYAQQTLVPKVAEGATVLVVGDSGTAGWAAQEAIRTGRKAIIIARDTSLPGVPPHVRKDLDAAGVRIVAGEVKSTSLEGGRVVLGIANSGAESVVRSEVGDGVALAIGQVQALPPGVESMHFRAIPETVNRKPRIVGLEAFDPETGKATGLVIQGAEMTTRPFKVGPKPFVALHAPRQVSLQIGWQCAGVPGGLFPARPQGGAAWERVS